MRKFVKLGLLGLSFLSLNFIVINVTYAEELGQVETVHQVKKTNNFESDKDAAEKWADKNYSLFNNFISKHQAASIKKADDIEKAMMWKGSNINKYPPSNDNSGLKNDIYNMREALSSNKGVLLEDLVVYKTVNLQDYLKFSDNHFFSSPVALLDGHIEELQGGWMGGFFPALQVFELTNNGQSTNNSNSNMKLKITIPKGTKTGYLDKNRIFVEDSLGFEVDRIDVITEKNRKYIDVEGHVATKEEYARIVQK